MAGRPRDLHEQFLAGRFDDAAIKSSTSPYHETRSTKVLFDDLGKSHTGAGCFIDTIEHGVSLLHCIVCVEPTAKPSEEHDHRYEPENCKWHPPPTVGERKDYGNADDEHKAAKVNAISVDQKAVEIELNPSWLTDGA